MPVGRKGQFPNDRTIFRHSLFLGIDAMRRKIIAGGGVIVKSEKQVAADSARWSGNRKRAFPKQKTVNSEGDESSAEKQFSEFLQRLRKFGTSNYTSPTRGTST